jgi:hypothetical protein
MWLKVQMSTVLLGERKNVMFNVMALIKYPVSHFIIHAKRDRGTCKNSGTT